MEKERLYEKKRHGTPGFPIAYYFVDKTHPRYVMPPHFHRELEIVRVISGSLRLQLQREAYLLQKDDIFVINSGCLHQALPENCVYECIVFDPAVLKQAPGGTVSEQTARFVNGELRLKPAVELPETKALLNELFSVMGKKSDFYELMVYSIVFRLFYGVMTSGAYEPVSPGGRASEKKRIITDMLGWLEKNYAQPISLDRLSAVSGYNKKYLCKIFKEYTGRSPIEYTNELRLNAACRDIKYNGISVTAAAFRNGFNDLSYFCRAFKSYAGCTPRQYKNGG